MADFKIFLKKLLLNEGKWSNDPNDSGGPTMLGITLKTWIRYGYDKNGDDKIDINDLKLITIDDAAKIAKPFYWDKIQADRIKNQSIAEILVDFAYNSGVGTASKKIQEIVDEKADGVIGPLTLYAINMYPQKDLFYMIKAMRKKYYLDIIKNNPSQERFRKGWLKRLDSFKFVP